MKNTYDLSERRIINYLRKVNNDETVLNIISLFYEKTTEENIPINKKIDDYNQLLFEKFPYYFHSKTREEIIELYNKEVAFNKYIKYPFTDLKDYDIKENTHLEISMKTFRPVYDEKWKEKAESINGTDIKNQQSFYNEYLKFYLQYKEFPTYHKFIKRLFTKYQKPLHKDIKIVFDNIEKSYQPIKEFIKINNLTFNEVKKIIIQSASLSSRIMMQA